MTSGARNDIRGPVIPAKAGIHRGVGSGSPPFACCVPTSQSVRGLGGWTGDALLILAAVGVEQCLFVIFGEFYSALEEFGSEPFPLLLPAFIPASRFGFGVGFGGVSASDLGCFLEHCSDSFDCEGDDRQKRPLLLRGADAVGRHDPVV